MDSQAVAALLSYTRLADHYHGGAARQLRCNCVIEHCSASVRGMRGVYQHYGEKRLPCVGLGLNDTDRAELALMGIVGKRLPYRTTH